MSSLLLPRDIVKQIMWLAEPTQVARLSKFWKQFAYMKMQKERIIQDLRLIVEAFCNPVQKEDGSMAMPETFWDIMDANVFNTWERLSSTNLFGVYGVNANTTADVFKDILVEYEVSLSPTCLEYPRNQRPIDEEAFIALECSALNQKTSSFQKMVFDKAKGLLEMVPIRTVGVVAATCFVVFTAMKKKN